MDITKSQSDFEVACRNGLINYGLAKFENGEYASESTRAVFSGWLAGRESIEVERISPTDVPPDVVYQLGGAGLSHSMAICEAYSTGFNVALRTAGIRIKGESE